MVLLHLSMRMIYNQEHKSVWLVSECVSNDGKAWCAAEMHRYAFNFFLAFGTEYMVRPLFTSVESGVVVIFTELQSQISNATFPFYYFITNVGAPRSTRWSNFVRNSLAEQIISSNNALRRTPYPLRLNREIQSNCRTRTHSRQIFGSARVQDPSVFNISFKS